MSLDNVQVQELEAICDKACLIKKEINNLEEQADEKRKELRAYEDQIQGILEHFGKDNWKSGSGNIELRTRNSVKVPRTEEAKRALFHWLQEKGIYLETVTVNSNTLNALYKAELEACSQEGRDCQIPGLEAPTEYTTVIIKPK